MKPGRVVIQGHLALMEPRNYTLQVQNDHIQCSTLFSFCASSVFKFKTHRHSMLQINSTSDVVLIRCKQTLNSSPLYHLLVNYVLWRMITGKTIDKERLGVLIHIIREFFRISERSGISDILQVFCRTGTPT